MKSALTRLIAALEEGVTYLPADLRKVGVLAIGPQTTEETFVSKDVSVSGHDHLALRICFHGAQKAYQEIVHLMETSGAPWIPGFELSINSNPGKRQFNLRFFMFTNKDEEGVEVHNMLSANDVLLCLKQILVTLRMSKKGPTFLWLLDTQTYNNTYVKSADPLSASLLATAIVYPLIFSQILAGKKPLLPVLQHYNPQDQQLETHRNLLAVLNAQVNIIP